MATRSRIQIVEDLSGHRKGCTYTQGRGSHCVKPGDPVNYLGSEGMTPASMLGEKIEVKGGDRKTPGEQW